MRTKILLVTLLTVAVFLPSPASATGTRSDSDCGDVVVPGLVEFNCLAYTLDYSGGICYDNPVNQRLDCSTTYFTMTISAYSWVEDGDYAVYTYGFYAPGNFNGFGCWANGEGAWEGLPLGAGAGGSPVHATCPAFSVPYGTCYDPNIYVELYIGGSRPPFGDGRVFFSDGPHHGEQVCA